MGSIGTKHCSADIPEDFQATSLDSVDGPLFDSGEYKVRDLTYKVQHLTLLAAGGELPISSKQELWQDITDLSDALNRLRSLYPEELRAKSKSLLSLFESQLFSADRKPCLPRKMSVSVQCDDELFGSGLHSDSDGSVNSIRASSDSLAGDGAVTSSDRKSDIVYICSECNGTIRVFDNDAFSLSLKLHYEGAAHSQDSGQRSDKEDCRTTSGSSDRSSCSPSEVSVSPGEPVDDCFSLFSTAETKAAVNVCIVKPSHSENSVRLTRCGLDATPRHVTMWNSVRSRLVELGHVDYIVHHPGLKDFRCSLCKTSITGVQNIMQHVLGHTHTKLHLEEGGKPLCKDDPIQINGSSSDVSSIIDKEVKFEQEPKTKVFDAAQNCASLKKHNSVQELFSDQEMNFTPNLNSDGSVNYVAWQKMAQELRDRGLDACIQIFHCSLCSTQLTGIQKFIEHVHSYSHKDKTCQPKKQSRVHSTEKVLSVSSVGLRSSSSIEEISTLQYKCTPCNLTLTEKDVLAHLAGKKHALKESYVKNSLKEHVANVDSLCKSRFDSSKLSKKVVGNDSLREQNGIYLEKEHSPLTLNPCLRGGVEATPKCDQAAQTISISNNVVNSSEKDLGVASKKMLEVEKRYYSRKDALCRTGYNLYRYSSRQYNGMHTRKDDVLRSNLPCSYESLKRPAGYWCAVCNVMVDENQKYYHIHQDVKLPCVPQQQVYGNAQYLIMNHSQNWGQ